MMDFGIQDIDRRSHVVLPPSRTMIRPRNPSLLLAAGPVRSRVGVNLATPVDIVLVLDRAINILTWKRAASMLGHVLACTISIRADIPVP